MTGALRRYLATARATGAAPQLPGRHAGQPARPIERMAELGNQFGLIFLSLPVGIADPVERLAELRRRRARASSARPSRWSSTGS